MVGPKILTLDTATKTGSFIDTPDESGYVLSYKLGDEITSITIDRGDEPTYIVGTRIYFFIADNTATYSDNGFPPKFPYSTNGTTVTQVNNPPQDDYPIYSYFEYTYIPPAGHGDGLVIDVSTVDGFFFPLTVTFNNELQQQLGQLGQTLPSSSGFNRKAILNAYIPFMDQFGSAGTPYKDLQYSSNYGGLLNPSHFFPTANGLGSPLNTVFDDGLNTFFLNENLSITGDASGIVPTDTYTATSVTDKSYPHAGAPHPALLFTGTDHSNTFIIFNPVDFCLISYTDDAGAIHPIIGTINDTTLTFKTALPSATNFMLQMYVVGAGANPSTRITAVNHNPDGTIVSLTLNEGLQQPAPGSSYTFSQSPDFATSSGDMVFGNYGLFADTVGCTDATQNPIKCTDPDEQAVLQGIQRDIATAFNRGVANSGPASGSAGYTSVHWNTESNWYPADQPQNLFSYFMHTAIVNSTPLFTRPDNAVTSARGTTMAMAYGFGYDETPNTVPPATQVPSKYEPVPPGTITIPIILGPWDKTFSWPIFLPAFIHGVR